MPRLLASATKSLPRALKPFRCQGALRRVDGEEAAFESALHHARIVDLREIGLVGVSLHDVPARARKMGRHVEVRVEADEPIVQRAPSRHLRSRRSPRLYL